MGFSVQAVTPFWVYAFLAFYFSVSIVLFTYGMHAYLMAFLYHRAIRRRKATPEASEPPHVTIQLPIFNERYVARRLIDAVAAMDYPRNLLEVQVLDDSVDDTVSVVAEIVEEWRAKGLDIVHRHRTKRVGYKGGALREGLAEAKGELVAVFDADFIPPPHFLRATVPYFQDPALGMVQTRWTHLNEDYSVLTRAQAAALDGHFLIEHTVRNRNGAFINFNGTAGIWRKQCIVDAGNWQDDTLTEDLDLSYRAQLVGWQFLFLPHVECPAELPAEINGLKGQQFRWAKGSVQTAQKILPRILRTPLPAFTRLQAIIHLTSHVVYPLLLVLGVSALPALIILDHHPQVVWAFRAATVLVIASFGHPWLYLVSQRVRGRPWKRVLAVIPMVVAGNMGIAINNTRALIEALARRQSPFNRTPKYALITRRDKWKGKNYHVPVTAWPFLELLLAGFALASMVYAALNGHYLAIPFMMLYLVGAGYIGSVSLLNAWARWREGVAAQRLERGAMPGEVR
jgi:cellulose synthase/poly-beta-1,6-N-acetylglucosamine synthase-like glycosyltransferase